MFPVSEHHINRSPNTRSLSPSPERERPEPFSYFNSISYPSGDFFPAAPSSSPVGDEIQISEPLFFDIENPPTPKCNQFVQTEAESNVTEATKDPKTTKSVNPESPKSCQNSIVIHIGTVPQPSTITTIPQVICNPLQPSSTQNNDGSAPPAIPLPTLPTPNGISIPPPPQETDGTASAQHQAATSGNAQGCCACSCCKSINKTYLMYSLIAVCASLVIALVPSLVAILVKNNN